MDMKPEEIERVHEMVLSLELQLQNIGEHYPQLLGTALLAAATFIVEKVYLCSSDVKHANELLSAAQDTGLQGWIDMVEVDQPVEEA